MPVSIDSGNRLTVVEPTLLHRRIARQVPNFYSVSNDVRIIFECSLTIVIVNKNRQKLNNPLKNTNFTM